MKNLYEVNWHHNNGTLDRISVTPIKVLREGILPGCSEVSITAVDSNGHQFQGCPQDYFETEEAAWAQTKIELQEAIASEEQDIREAQRRIEGLRSVLSAIQGDEPAGVPRDAISVVGMPEFDALMDYIYEEGTSGEAVIRLANKLVRAAIQSHIIRARNAQPAPDVACNQSRESSMVVLERDADGKPTVWCDPEIADLVSALNKAGIRTVASCSGHGHRPGNIMLADGRELIIARDFDEARKIDAMFPGINGEPPMVDVKALVRLDDYEALQAELERWKNGSTIRDEQNEELHQYVLELKTEIEELRKDAERYRFLCNPSGAEEDYLSHAVNTLNSWVDKIEIDQAADSAMRERYYDN